MSITADINVRTATTMERMTEAFYDHPNDSLEVKNRSFHIKADVDLGVESFHTVVQFNPKIKEKPQFDASATPNGIDKSTHLHLHNSNTGGKTDFEVNGSRYRIKAEVSHAALAGIQQCFDRVSNGRHTLEVRLYRTPIQLHSPMTGTLSSEGTQQVPRQRADSGEGQRVPESRV